MSYSERLSRAQDIALERAYNASLDPPDDYYFDIGQDPEEEEGEESE